MGAKAGSITDLISVPKGGGALKCLGEKFSPDLHTGTGNFSVPIALPQGRNGFQPALTLGFSTGSGNGPFGLGWSLSVPGVSRLTSKGIPRYTVDPPDTFVLSGAEDLVEVERDNGVPAYRPRTEGLFARITHHASEVAGAETDHWAVRTKDGLVSIYGTPNAALVEGAPDERAVTADPNDRRNVFAWRLTETRDPFGNRIVYEYRRDAASGRGRNWDQQYLRRIRYVDLDGPDQEEFLVSVEFLYDDEASPSAVTPDSPTKPRPDAFSDYRAGFEIRTRRRCKWIVVRTHPAKNRAVLVRAYEFIYLDEQTSDPARLPLNGASLLSRINVIGYDDQGVAHRELPPLDFGYSRFQPEGRRFVALQGVDLPASTLSNPDLELVDLFGHGLPDIVELGGTVRYWRNLGNGHFDRSRPFSQAPASWKLSDPGVQLLDANGDGRADLLVTTAELAGYYPLDFRGEFSRKSFQRYHQAPSFSLEDPEVRLVDLTGDGVTDVLRSGTSFECYFNHPKDGWLPRNTKRVQRQRLDAFPDVSFADPRVKFADMSGDGLQDIAVVYEGRIDYWPNLGYGRWGNRVATTLPARLPANFDPQRVLLGDVDGDGLADLVYVSDREVTLWVNRTGNGWSAPITIRGTPAVNTMVTVRLTDLLGTGVPGVLWTRDADGSGRPQHFFLDFAGGRKPYLLDRMDNNLGAVTTVTYASSTQFYLRDESSPSTRWRSTLPFPVQVIERVTVNDELSGGQLSTEYRYHHGYWDGEEREFRGFGMVEQLDTEVFEGYTGRGITSDDPALQRLLQQQSFSPPLLTRTWFHQGPVDPSDDGHWRELDWSGECWRDDPHLLGHTQAVDTFLNTLAVEQRRDALRTLRGSMLRSETYALDGSALVDRPYTVIEHAYALREESTTPGSGARKRIYFPHAVAQRTTQWERGNDPLTQFTYTGSYDEFGQPRRQTSISCPRGWRALGDTTATGFLATLSHTEYASDRPADLFIRDRVARTRAFELTATVGKTIPQLAAATETDGALRLIAESLNYYDGDAFVGLPIGQLGRSGTLVRTESLVVTSDQLEAAYGQAIPPYLIPGAAFDPGNEYPADFVASMPLVAGYIYRAGSANGPARYFAISASTRYDFHDAQGAGRGLALAQRDPLGHESTIGYDAYGLLPIRVTGPTGLSVHAEHDYRVLQPKRVTDPNSNVTEVTYSPTGLVTDSWLRGKPLRNEGDVGQPSVHMEYALRAFYDSKRADPEHPQPVFVRAIRRAFHDSDPDDTGETIEAREYSDGFGRLLQTRTQSEAVRFGDEHFGGGNAVLSQEQSTGAGDKVVGAENTDAASPNVVVSGWQRYDNKGRVIEKFEPFYDIGGLFQPEQEAKQGRFVTMYYDPRGQVVRTVNPDGSEQRVIYGVPNSLDNPPLSPLDTTKFAPTPWEAYTYDPNDNAGRTHAGKAPHTGYRQHYNTPASIEIDALGRTVRAVARHRESPATPRSPLPPIEEHVTRSSYDIQGNLLGIYDALGRLAFEYVYDLAKRPLRTESIDAGRKLAIMDAAGNAIEGRDAKGALILHAYDALHRPTHLWARDAAGENMTLRGQLLYDRDSADPDHAANHNLLGKLVKHFDEAGVVAIADCDFKGNVLDSSRQVLSDDFMLGDYRAQTGPAWVLTAPRVDWAAPAANLLDAMTYRTRSDFDALNRIKWSQYPQCANGEQYRLRPDYNRAGALQRVDLEGPLNANGQGQLVPYVVRIAYNAKGQRTLIAYGNGLMTRYAYDSDTFRLARMRTEKYEQPDHLTYAPNGRLLQDLAYMYDLSGNILRITDRTRGSGIQDNPTALSYPDLQSLLASGDALVREFAYDPLYQLTSATGRECSSDLDPRFTADADRCGYNSGRHGTANQDNAPQMTSWYEQRYEYDPAGNMLRLSHRKDGGSAWARHFGMSGFQPREWQQRVTDFLAGSTPDWGGQGNRLTNFGNDEEHAISHAYDANGNLVLENSERHFEWDSVDRMKVFRNQTDTSKPTIYALYLYDSGGQRVKKLVVTGNGYRTTTYLGSAFEHHAEFDQLNGTGKKENCSLHVTDAKSRIAIKRAGEAFERDEAAAHQVQYHLADHLGSSGLVVGDSGEWINREEFFPYGEPSFGSFTKKRYKFMGKEKDEESGLQQHPARYYSQHLHKWLSTDPAGPLTAVNLYRAFANSPSNVVDPLGTEDRPGGVVFEDTASPAKAETLLEADEVAGIGGDLSPPVYGRYTPHNMNLVVRRTNFGNPLREGFRSTDSAATNSAAEHVLNQQQTSPSKSGSSKWISASRAELGASSHPNAGDKITGSRYGIDVDAAMKEGAEFVDHPELAEMVKSEFPLRTQWIAAQEYEGGEVVLSNVPASAVKSPTWVWANYLTNKAVKGLEHGGWFLAGFRMGQAAEQGVRTGSTTPVAEAGVKEAGGLAGAWAGAKIGVELGFLVGIETGPGAVGTAFIGSVIGGLVGVGAVENALDPQVQIRRQEAIRLSMQGASFSQ